MGVWDWAVAAIYYVSFVAIVIGYAWTVVLFVTGGRYLRFCANARQEVKPTICGYSWCRPSMGGHDRRQRGASARSVSATQDHPGDQ